MQTVAILGSTGSIGQSTLRVVRQHPDRFKIFALSGYHQLKQLVQDIAEFQPELVTVPEERVDGLSAFLSERVPNWQGSILAGVEGLVAMVTDARVDTVMSAIVGAAGLVPTLAAVQAGKKVLLANKESLVMAGTLLLDAAQKSGAKILPVDSEHNAVFQCYPRLLEAGNRDQIDHILLTASGGPFRTWSLQQLQTAATPQRACKHPNWSMGQKISVDSATLMNKGLEMIEAAWLFDLPEDQIRVVVHPQSIIHSMVQFRDGSVIAQLGTPEMCTPIAYTLSWPERLELDMPRLDWTSLTALTFESPDTVRFPCLQLARQCLREGQCASIVLNAANEIAVAAFLEERLAFMQIPAVIEETLTKYSMTTIDSVGTILETDRAARQIAISLVENKKSRNPLQEQPD